MDELQPIIIRGSDSVRVIFTGPVYNALPVTITLHHTIDNLPCQEMRVPMVFHLHGEYWIVASFRGHFAHVQGVVSWSHRLPTIFSQPSIYKFVHITACDGETLTQPATSISWKRYTCTVQYFLLATPTLTASEFFPTVTS